jgi:peptidoglycan hydrolase-like protein with peptidoglycan-binding domain
MKRIICHWTGGSYRGGALARKHYHFTFNGDGTEVVGDHSISANARNLRPGRYAAHTSKCNTGSIGLSVACMHKAKEHNFGKYPMTEAQFEAMCAKAARLCEQYDIPVTARTVLSHAEVQPTLGIRQAGKWDFTRLPFKPELKGHKACGDYMRGRVREYMKGSQVMGLLQPSGDDVQDHNYNTITDTDDIQLRFGMANPLVGELQELLNAKGYWCGAVDEHFGGETRRAVLGMKADNTLPTGTESISLKEARACNDREVSVDRAEAPVEQVVANSKTAQMASDAVKANMGKIGAGVATTTAAVNIDSPQDALNKAQDALGQAEQGKEVLTRSQDIIEQLTGGAVDMKTVLIMLGCVMTVAAVYGAWKSRGALMRRVEDYQSGKNL